MLNRILITFALLSLSATLAEAGPFSYLNKQQYYVSASGAVSLGLNKNMNFRSTGNATRDGDGNFKTGFGFSGAFGAHLWDSWRVELEYSLRRNAYDSFDGTNPNAPLANPVEGNLTHHNLMVNFLYDVNLDVNYYWYAGGGIGVSFSRLDLDGYGKDMDASFAFQMMTGIGYRISRDTSLYFGYRLFNTFEQDYSFSALGGTNNVEGELEGLNAIHSFEAGVRFDF